MPHAETESAIDRDQRMGLLCSFSLLASLSQGEAHIGVASGITGSLACLAYKTQHFYFHRSTL